MNRIEPGYLPPKASMTSSSLRIVKSLISPPICAEPTQEAVLAAFRTAISRIRRPLGAGLCGLRDLDLALQDLPRRTLRELVREPDLARVLVAGDLLLDVLLALVRGGLPATLE